MDQRRTSRHSATRRLPHLSAADRAMALRLGLVAVAALTAGLLVNAVTDDGGPDPAIGGWATSYPAGSVSVPPPPAPAGDAAPSLVPVSGGGPVGATPPSRPRSGPGPVASDDRRATPPTTSPTRRDPSPTTSPRTPAPTRSAPAAYPTVQAESYDEEHGVRMESGGGGTHIGFIADDDWVRYDRVDFTGDAARSVLLRTSNGARQNRTGRVEVRIDRRSNPPIGSMTIPNTGDWFAFSTYRMDIRATTGVHTVYLTFTSRQDEEFANVDWFRLAR